MSESTLTCLSTFTGLGGLDLGLEAAGFVNLACVEWDDVARRSLKVNRGDRWNVLPERDIEAVAAASQPRDFGLQRGELDLLSGAPPCQPYSKAAQWAPGARQGLADRRGQYLDDLLLLVAALLPKVVLIENVRGFVTGRTSALPRLAKRLTELCGTDTSYRIEHRVLDAADYGVPQHRARAIVILTRMPHEFVWPRRAEMRAAWDAIGGSVDEGERPRSVGKWADLLPSIPEGENYLWHTNRGGGAPLFGYRTRYWSFLLKLAKDRPSWTLPAQPGPATGPFHWENRPLTATEMLRLQSFPAEWIVEGSRVEQVRQIGNATPPLLAEAIGSAIAAHIRGDATVAEPRKLVIKARRPIPPADPPAPIEHKYLALRGEHADHPGSGRGPGAHRLR